MLSSFTATTRWRERYGGFQEPRSGEQRNALRRSRTISQAEQFTRREGTSSFLIEQITKIRHIRRIYNICHEVETIHFLHEHPALIDLLLEAPAQIERYFGSSSLLTLELATDPEDLDSTELFVNIGVPLPVDDAIARLDRFDEGWFLAQLERTDGRLNFNLEFI